MKVFLLVFLLISLLASCSIKTQPGTGLKGKVRYDIIYGYDIKHPENKDWTYKVIETYNELGQMLGEQLHLKLNGKDSVFISSTYVYNAKGYKTQTLDSKGKETGKYEYSDDGLVEKNWFGATLSQIIHKDKKGNIIEKFNYDAAGKYHYKISYRYITRNKVEEAYLSDDWTINYNRIVTYNKWHNIVDDIILNADGTRRSHEKCIYNNSGNLVTRIDSNLQNVGGKPMKKEGENIYTGNYKYDIVDKKGNWLQQSYLIENNFVPCVKRDIEYY